MKSPPHIQQQVLRIHFTFGDKIWIDLIFIWKITYEIYANIQELSWLICCLCLEYIVCCLGSISSPIFYLTLLSVVFLPSLGITRWELGLDWESSYLACMSPSGKNDYFWSLRSYKGYFHACMEEKCHVTSPQPVSPIISPLHLAGISQIFSVL